MEVLHDSALNIVMQSKNNVRFQPRIATYKNLHDVISFNIVYYKLVKCIRKQECQALYADLSGKT